MTKIIKKFLLFAFCAALFLPHLAEARAGHGSSMGSMGSHTYQSSPLASPIQRSMTPPPAAMPSPQATPGYNPAYNPGFASSHPFLTGIFGGFLGAGLAHMLFGGGYGMGLGGFGGVLPLLLLAALGYFILRSMRSGAGAGSLGNFPPQFSGADAAFNAPSTSLMAAAPTIGETPLTPTAEDYQNFMQLLEKVQLAWGSADLNHLRQYVTPEMLGYFSEELSANVSRGIVNHIADVVVTEGVLIQAWSEADLDYATVQFKWRAIDYMARLDRQPNDSDYIVSGDATHPVEAEEFWTFARAQGGGHWLLSAIQQPAARINAA